MTPRQAYQQALSLKRLEPCAEQLAVIDKFEELYQKLITQTRSDRFWRWLCIKVFGHAQPISGIYLWGYVGRGKTELMDLFYATLPSAIKKRIHFHQWMASIHESLATLKGHASPLDIVVERFTKGLQVLCIDEFLVTDIADAMILSATLNALYARGITLVITSNTPPDNLYANGLQRDAFLPAIAKIKAHSTVLNLTGSVDFRLRYLSHHALYQPAGVAANEAFKEAFARLSLEPPLIGASLEIAHRPIPTKQMADGLVWFSFESLCASARSAADYCEIARLFHTIILTDIPVMTEHNEEACRRFIHAIDAFYDRRTKLLVSAAAEPLALYQGQRLKPMMERTISRLMEMRTQMYLEQAHQP